MARTFRIGGRRRYPPRRVAYRMTDGRVFYEKQPRKFPYGILPYVQNYYWTAGYTADD
mgnify:CR=1 FL=1|jgi:hypothetical protein